MSRVLEDLRRTLEEKVLRGPGHTRSELRTRLAEGAGPPEGLGPLVDKIRCHAYRVTAEDLVALRGAYTEDELFEIVVSTSLGTAMKRLDAGLRALDACSAERDTTTSAQAEET